jgi:hypothetical protein
MEFGVHHRDRDGEVVGIEAVVFGEYLQLYAQLAHSVFRHPMQCIRTLHCSHLSPIMSAHLSHLIPSINDL